MVAKVDGRINLKREFGASVQQAVSERTARLNKEAQPRSAIILEAPSSSSSSSGKSSSRTQQAKPAAVSKQVLPPAPATGRSTEVKGQAALTPPKSDGSPSSVSSSPSGPKHRIPDSFNALNLTIPARWDRDVPIPIRVIHLLALKPMSEAELLTEAKLAAEAERREAIQAMNIVCQNFIVDEFQLNFFFKLCELQEDRLFHLRDQAFYYLRPWCWVNYSLPNRAEASKHMRSALRRLGYDDQDGVWECIRRQNGWVDPWKNTPEGALYYREKEQKKTASTSNTSKEDHEKRKAEALANPAPMLTSTIKPGFFSSAPVIKPKKVTKEKEPKVKKEKMTVKKESEKEPATVPKMAQSASQGSSTPTVEPTIQEIELKRRQSGPGSTGGKQAIARRIQREKEDGFASTVSTPTRSPLPLPGSGPNSTHAAKAESKKRKAEDDDYQEGGPSKKKKAPIAASATQLPSTSASQSSTSKKRKGDDIQSLSPPPKARKSETGTSHSYKASTSSVHGHEAVKKASTSRKEITSATRDYNGKRPNGRPQWDYSSDENDTTPAPKSTMRREESRNSLNLQLGLPKLHRVPPPTTYMGFKAVFYQKWAEYGMVCGMIMGEEAKLENLGAGDDSSTLMSMDELKALFRKRNNLEADLKELKAEIGRLAAKGA